MRLALCKHTSLQVMEGLTKSTGSICQSQHLLPQGVGPISDWLSLFEALSSPKRWVAFSKGKLHFLWYLGHCD